MRRRNGWYYQGEGNEVAHENSGSKAENTRIKKLLVTLSDQH
ncbi:hypothetical protein [Buttiauxella brennerae]|nr:hypothetical protein [Buttiauxella brennerae]